jgi:putative flavoprotein involved in K+ transport
MPIQHGTEVLSLTRRDRRFVAETNRGTYTAKHVIAAAGPFQTPYVPPFARALDAAVNQLHSAAYRNPRDLLPGPILIVGAGNSGAQIAVELAESADQPVTLSVGQPLTFMPLSFLGRSAFWWFDKLGLLNASPDTFPGKAIRRRPDPIFGFELREYLKSRRIALRPRAARAEGKTVFFADGTSMEAANVIWATGFRADYAWLRIPGALNEQGLPIHRKGVSPVSGLYYVGLPWQTSRNSALLGGVGRDAAAIAARIAKDESS